MKNILVVAATAVLCVLAAGRARAQEAGIKLNAVAPGAAVETLDGKQVDLGTYLRRTPVVLEFWATWCPLCRELEPQLQAAREKYAGRVTFVSVGVKDNQTPEKQKAYAESHHLGGEFVFDRDGKAVGAYQAPHTSYLVVIDGDGKVVYTGVGVKQNVDDAVAKALPMKGMSKMGSR